MLLNIITIDNELQKFTPLPLWPGLKFLDKGKISPR